MKKNNKGFTLAELLIVVAIIGVLVAISIPILAKQLERARLATNQANARAAYAATITKYIDDGMPVKSEPICYTFNVSTGKLESKGAVNYGCKVRAYETGPGITDISAWQPTTLANITSTRKHTLGSDVYKYWQIIILNGEIEEYDALFLSKPGDHT